LIGIDSPKQVIVTRSGRVETQATPHNAQPSAANSGAARPRPRAAYVHVPFCRHRCGYCNFTLVADHDELIPRYFDALQRELADLGPANHVDTLFWGGGTHTHLQLPELDQLAELVGRSFPLAAGGEWSVEANPSDLNDDRCRWLADHGVTRISLGAQSFQPAKLQQLERDHDAATIERACERLRPRLADLSIDLIFAVPGESLDDWRGDLMAALQLRPDHVSTYGLTYEKGTPFWTRRQHGELRLVAEEDEARMYEMAIDVLTAAGYEHYEVSSFALPGHRCRHNQVYWTGGEYFGVGPGAASLIGGTRRTNHRSTWTYIQRLSRNESPVAECETLSPADRGRERLVFGLRRLEGIERRRFQAETGFTMEQLVGDVLAQYIAAGLLNDDGCRVRLTRKGLLISDAMWPAFL
jgi:oxygen-independent coproporphyrinogen III oxidase